MNKQYNGLDVANLRAVHWNLPAPTLYEHIIRNKEGHISQSGPVVVTTGEHTGRSPHDRFVVREAGSQDLIWWGNSNREISPEHFEKLHQKVLNYFDGKTAYVQDSYVGHDERYRVSVRVVTEFAWQSLFAKNMFVDGDFNGALPEYTVIAAPNLKADPPTDGTHSGAFVVINLAQKLVLIGGTSYAGEIKKSMFSIMNYLMPQQGVMSMHCSANYGDQPDDVAVFFGLSGTGKTTLSNDITRTLIGDDEHGWSDEGVFNYEGGCYAKMIRLSEAGEPQIYSTTRQFGTILENVVLDPATRHIDLNDGSLTENTRGSYPLSHIDHTLEYAVAGHPKHIFFLTADAFGVLPPISKLTPEQAQYHFLAGYTAKVSGTEKGLSNEPKATFSTCFGAPFMMLHPTVYAQLLSEKIEQHACQVWLINTGWTGGAFGVGERIKLQYTRAMVQAALRGDLDDVPTTPDPLFGVHVPDNVPDVPDRLLQPRETWADPVEYDQQAMKLAEMFHRHFEPFEEFAALEVQMAAPKLPVAF